MSCPASDGPAQVIGVAYTYEVSRAARRALAGGDTAHSSWSDSFSFFFKCRLDEAVPDGGRLRLRPGAVGAPHWPEAELAALLGEGHEVVAYALANDLTAFTVEVAAGVGDSTYDGKVWPGSCALGPAFVPARALGPVDDLPVGLRVERAGRVVFRDEYRTSARRLQFAEIPDLIAGRVRRAGGPPRPSKRVRLDEGCLLPPGTVVLLGTGLIVPREAYCRAGDRVTVWCPGLGELTNVVSAA